VAVGSDSAYSDTAWPRDDWKHVSTLSHDDDDDDDLSTVIIRKESPLSSDSLTSQYMTLTIVQTSYGVVSSSDVVDVLKLMRRPD